MGATVVLNSGVAYYVHGMERWPDDVDGKCVTATGILKTVAIAPAGVIREIRVIREIDWRLMSSEPELVPGQSAKQLPVLLPTAGAINDDEHGGPRTIRSRIGRISKEAYDMMTHTDIEVAYDASKSMTLEHGSNLRTPPGPTARPPPPATVAGHLTPSRSTPYILQVGAEAAAVTRLRRWAKGGPEVRVGSSASARLLVFLSEQRFKGGRRNTSTIVEPDGDAPAGGGCTEVNQYTMHAIRRDYFIPCFQVSHAYMKRLQPFDRMFHQQSQWRYTKL
jgi:hypothetical protein